MVTVTPGSTPPEESTTRQPILPRESCGANDNGEARAKTAVKTRGAIHVVCLHMTGSWKREFQLWCKTPMLTLLDPQHRLPHEEIAHHFFDVRVGGQLTPKGEVLLFTEGQTCKQQRRMPHRPFVVVHDVGLVRPCLLVGDERKQERHGLPDPAPIRQLVGP